MSKSNTEEPAVKKAKTEGAVPSAVKQEVEVIVKALNERLDTHDNNRKEVQEKLHSVCEKWRKEIDDLEDKINSELEAKFKEEDSRLQTTLNDLQTATISAEETKLEEALQKAKAELLVVQRYSLSEEEIEVPAEISKRLELKTGKEVAPEWFDKPRDLKVNKVGNTGRIFLSFTRNTEQERVLAENEFDEKITYKALLQKKGGEDSGKEHSLRKEEEENCFSFVPDFLEAETTYTVKVKAELQGKEDEWSEEAEFITPKDLWCCVWKKCPDNVDVNRKYSVDEMNPRIATKINSSGYWWCTIIGNTPLPHNKVTSWNIKILKSSNNNGGNILIGIAPSNINQNEDNYSKCGWYFNCGDSTLYSGPPHNYGNNVYGPRKERGEYVHTGDSVGVVMDTAKGELSFIVNGANLGVAYKVIPLDRPLVPCVLLYWQGDSVELII